MRFKLRKTDTPTEPEGNGLHEGDLVRISHPGNPINGLHPVTIEGRITVYRTGDGVLAGRDTFIELPWFGTRLYAGPDMGYGWTCEKLEDGGEG